jgi:hypothetical protein
LWFGIRPCVRLDKCSLQSAIFCGNGLPWSGAVATHLDYVGVEVLDGMTLYPAGG